MLLVVRKMFEYAHGEKSQPAIELKQHACIIYTYHRLLVLIVKYTFSHSWLQASSFERVHNKQHKPAVR